MNILITGARGFVGKNLAEALRNIQQKKDRTRPKLIVENIYEYDVATEPALLDDYCKSADFVFNLAGVNRPKNNEEFMAGFASTLLNTLKKHHNTSPVMLASSIQASLTGRYGDSDYGKSKLAGEQLFFKYAQETGAKVLVYRFPNLFGKWCRPNYNSVVATFCHNIANDLPIQVNDPSTQLELLYIDDLITELLDALEGNEHLCEYDPGEPAEMIIKSDEADRRRYCYAPVTHKAALGEIAELLDLPAAAPVSPYASYSLQFLPKEAVFHISVLFTGKQDKIPVKNELRRQGQLHRAVKDG